MSSKKLKILLVGVVASVFILAAPLALASDSFFPLLICGYKGSPSGHEICTICDIFLQIQHLINFFFYYLVPVAATCLFVYGGFLILLGGANPATVKQGYDVFRKTAIGLLLIFGAWMITNLALRTIAGSNSPALGWWSLEIQCPDEANPSGGGGGPGSADQLVITTVSLPRTAVDGDYSVKLEAKGGVIPYAWLVKSGELPSGLKLDPTSGTISGKSDTVGSKDFVIQVKDSAKQTAEKSFTIKTVLAFKGGGGKSGGGGADGSWNELTITTTKLPDAKMGEAYSQTLESAYGEGPYEWTVTKGNLPEGLVLGLGSGEISGKPTKVGFFSIEFTVKDKNAVTDRRVLGLTVVAGGGGTAACNDSELISLAQQAINSGLVFSTSSDCGGGHQARENINDIAAGKCPAVCNAGGCSGSAKQCDASTCPAGGTTGTTTVNKGLLRAIIALQANKQGASTIQIESLTTGSHSCQPTDSHYLGNAVDITFAPATQTVAEEIRNFMKSQPGAVTSQIACEGNGGGFNTASPCTNVGGAGSGFHIHAEVRDAGGSTGGGNRGGSCFGGFGVSCRGNLAGNTIDDTISCTPVSPSGGCAESTINQTYAAAIQRGAGTISICSGVDTVTMIKAIAGEESRGNPGLTSYNNGSTSSAYGLFQIQPATARGLARACGIDASTMPNDAAWASWLKRTDTIDKQACIVAQMLKLQAGPCGCSVRQLAAGYDSPSACSVSANCGPAAAADGGQCSVCPNQKDDTKKWECIWEDNKHQTCNIAHTGNFAETRKMVPQVEFCYNQFK